MRSISNSIAAVVLVVAAACGNAQDTTLIPALEVLAQSGNAEAMYHLGMAYQTGSGVPENHAKALDSFRASAKLGDPLGSYKLGCYYNGQGAGLVASDPALALRYKLVAAKAGYALAQQDVGVLYAQSGDAPAGLAWLERSAAQGWSGGLMALASVYNGASGVKPDAAKTAAYFRLFLSRSEPNEKQIAWLQSFDEHLSAEDQKRVGEIVRNYRPAPTELTLKALSGQRAALSVVKSASRK